MKKLAHQTFLPAFVSSLVTLAGCGGGGTPNSTPQSYSVSGSVAGLASGESVVLLDNGGDALKVSTDGGYTFATALDTGATYSVTVGTQPVGQTCTVAQGSGTVRTQSITGIAVTCTVNTYTIGGEITGLGGASGLVLVNGSDTYPVPAGATSYTMPIKVAYGSAYDVTVQTHPPALNCTLTGGVGATVTSNVTNISISCSPGTVSILYSFYGGMDGGAPYGSLIQASNANLYGMTAGGGAYAGGTVFEFTPGGTESILYSFAGLTDGQGPDGSLVQGNDGSFYGMTETGGAGDGGTAFKITPAGAETVLHSFGSTITDGRNPYGNLIQASDGNFYGLTNGGGASGDGTVFELTAAGTETVLHSFAGGSNDGLGPYGSLIQATDGNLYGLTAAGGANNDGTVFKITLEGTEAALYSFAGGTGDGAHPYGSLIQASDGNFYGMTSSGGAYGLGTVFKMTPAGIETILHSFAGTAADDGATPEGSLIQANDGNFYGMTEKGGAYISGAIFEITPTGTEAVLYSFPGAYGGEATPYGDLVQTSDGNLYGLGNFGTYTYGEVFVLN
jgi:uncharacterized repeat protein (TIGR03803 family)